MPLIYLDPEYLGHTRTGKYGLRSLTKGNQLAAIVNWLTIALHATRHKVEH